jgi:enamine deaminase RidA (YjgF/YER057c/UK114 family)
MTTKAHSPSSVPAPIGNYSLGLEIPAGSRLLFISGQIPEALGGEVPPAFEDQCNLVWDHILSILRSADMSAADLVKVTTFLGSREYAEANSRIRRERLDSHAPALTVVAVQILDPRWLLEIEAVAATGS